MGFLDFFRGGPSQDKFAKLMLTRLRQAGEAAEITYDRENFTLQKEDGFIWFLKNAYHEYCRAEKADREKVIHAFLATWASTRFELPENFEDAQADILPMLRSRGFYEVGCQIAAVQSKEDPHVPPYQILGDWLAVALGYDMPTHVRTLSQEDLDNWGVTLYEALEVARQNLRETTSQCMQMNGMYCFSHGDAYDSSRLILTDLVRELEVQGDIVAMVPNREILLVTGSEDIEGQTAMLDLAEKELQHERYVSGMAYCLRDGDWEPWLPPQDHPHAERFRTHRLQSIGQEYAEQRAYLEALYERDGIDLHVANYSALKDNNSKESRSYCVWSETVEAILPVTDLVMFFQPTEDGKGNVVGPVPWERVQQVVGDLMKPEEFFPERLHVREFPTPEQLTTLASESVGRPKA